MWLENLMRRDHALDLSVDGNIKIEWTLGEVGAKVWNGLTCLMIRKISGLF
jgi:hypothetical protein